MYLADQSQGEIRIARIVRAVGQSEKVADRESVGPQIPLRGLVGGEPGALCEAHHELLGLLHR